MMMLRHHCSSKNSLMNAKHIRQWFSTVGIVRESYNKWERRAPLAPKHVEKLVAAGTNVLLQPSDSRIFTNEQYEHAGAVLAEDLSPADVILGVKQIKTLLPNKTYCFFSHTIKGQEENMDLLNDALEKKVRLVDYECITDGGKRNGSRLIAFGSYAGRAGMIDTLRGVGERLLSRGYSTPFLNIGSAYMYGDLSNAKEAVERAGHEIESLGLPSEISPMVFTFTGNGNVSKGAQEIFKLLPHRFVTPEELPLLTNEPNNILYGLIAQENEMVELRNGGDAAVDKLDYYQHPEKYKPVFHRDIAPYTSVLMNCAYWDDRYPRLLTTAQLKDIKDKGGRLIAIGDISCDINGSIEFLSRSTEIESPFFLYDVVNDCEAGSNLMARSDDEGCIAMMGVDILPSELPRESTLYFGDHLLPYVSQLVSSNPSRPIDEQTDLSPELRGACITANGSLAPSFEYIKAIANERRRSSSFSNNSSSSSSSTCVKLTGDLFDTGLINEALNVIEADGGEFYMVSCQVRPNSNNSSTTLQITMSSATALSETLAKIRTLCQDQVMTELPDLCAGDYSKTTAPVRKESAANSVAAENLATVVSPSSKKVLCLGAGLVVAPLLEYLSRQPDTQVEVVSGLDGEAQALAAKLSRRNVTGSTFDAIADANDISKKCSESDCVVSLLPATMHVPVAKACISHSTPLVTASYISPEMSALRESAVAAGIPILCEMGLDPGMDHMSAMKVIDEVKASGGRVNTFSSVCGGLPSPEDADNPLAYKFSWSPRGVLTAAQNTARYRKDGNEVNVTSDDLLSTYEGVNFLPAFSLEQLPNRDSIPYASLYGIPDADSIFRGTLRYAGWSNIMYQCKQLGLLNADDASKSLPSNWADLMKELQEQNKSVLLDEDCRRCLEWLGLYSTDLAVDNSSTVMDAFCSLLMKKLAYAEGERDLAIMHHEFGVSYEDSRESKVLTSTYVGYGNGETGESIMAKTVGVTAAIGVQLVLDGAVKSKGVLAPTTPDIYIPGLRKLEEEGITFKESSRTA